MNATPRPLLSRLVGCLLLPPALLLAGCQSPAPAVDLDRAPPAASALDGRPWLLAQLAGQWVVMADQRRTPQVAFDGPAQRVSGYDGCNRFSGTLRQSGERLKIGPLASTRMACPPSMAPEREFVQAIEAATRWRVAGDRLELYASGDEPLLVLRAERPAAGGR